MQLHACIGHAGTHYIVACVASEAIVPVNIQYKRKQLIPS